MTDYNDGNWHIWNGRDGDRCPVNPDSRIDLQCWLGQAYTNDRAGMHDWQCPLMFRVTKPAPDGPREFWITGGCEAWDNELEATNSLRRLNDKTIIHVREVMP